MAAPLQLHPDRLFSSDETQRGIARRLYAEVKDLPIISPHGHTDPSWFALNEPFPDPAQLLIVPDHYVFRMLYSQGIPLEALGVPSVDGTPVETDGRKIWHRFAENYFLFRGTPSRMWLDWVFAEVFGLDVLLSPETADLYYDTIDAALRTDEFRPRALFDRYKMEALATTEGALDDLAHHKTIAASGWGGQVITTYRPDAVVDPEMPGFADNVRKLGELTGENVENWDGYLAAHRTRRAYFREVGGATATDHGHATAKTLDLPRAEAEALFGRVLSGDARPGDAEAFRAQMLTEMARMSVEDGMTMQIHPGAHRNHNEGVLTRFGRDKGGDIPAPTEYVTALKPLLNAVGNEPNLNVIVFTLDEDSYSRELAPLAGHYPALTLGPPWWFHDSPEGMRRFRERTTETAGFYNTAGFNDDTRAFLSIPARHDVARRMDCVWLAQLVAEHHLPEDEAAEVAHELAYGLAKKAYRL
ncbi:glucuronate isomerase [Parvularcula dongshanensis]|uniref:Uronate isomerase n=1 Tax=Parvularcula dongshanensis TaxID=1173995 RepID=A0A840I3U0_9PROT|nr:glucuronate isomerase [Parvularcula dongshanensis]MBB4659447.1 glucuronate isomerase [Parvularcula dongshanensis]